MVRITVKFLSIARLHAGTPSVELDLPGNTLKEAVLEVVRMYDIQDIILTSRGEVRPWARVLVNGRSQEFIGGLDLPLSEGDRVALVYPYTEAF